MGKVYDLLTLFFSKQAKPTVFLGICVVIASLRSLDIVNAEADPLPNMFGKIYLCAEHLLNSFRGYIFKL